MTDINELARQFKQLEDQLVICIRCGMCQAACPVFEQTGREADVARGKLALLNGLMARMFDDPVGVSNRLNKCLLCGSCAANCPSGVNALEIFITARGILTGFMGLSPAKKIIFRQMLSRPKLFNSLLGMAKKFQGLVSKENQNTQGTSCARFDLPLVGHRHFKPLSKTAFHQVQRTLELPENKNGTRVAFFTGCLIDKIFPQIALATVTIFKHHDISLAVPENQGCCGIPALASGDRDTFDALVRHHIDLLDPESANQEPFDFLVTACATCTSTIKKLWPALTPDSDPDLKEKASRLAEKTMDINQFLVDVANVDDSSPDATGRRVTYHDPCHLKKSLGISEQPRKLIKAAGFTLSEMAGADKCCGMGGSFNLFHYDISSRIGNLKQQNIVDTGCDTIATGCPACMMQISDMLSKAGTDVQVKHPVELYADAIQAP